MATMLENESMTLKDGRTLSYAIYGSPAAVSTVIYLHGFPSSRFEAKLWHTACGRNNIRLISFDQPGMGLSSIQPNRRLLDCPADVLALADHLQVKEFYILGVSGGGPYTLACIKEIGKDRLLGGTIVSGLYPVKFGTAGMMLSSRILLWITPWATGLTTVLFDAMMGKASRNEDQKVLEDQMAKEMHKRHPGDRKAIEAPENWPIFVAMTREAFHQGSEGAGWDARIKGSDWGFEVEQLDVGGKGVPLTLWHGTDDRLCPVSMAKTAKEKMPQSVLHLMEGEGHVSFIFSNQDTILGELLGLKGAEENLQESQ